MKINRIYLYDEPTVPEIKIQDLANFIKETLEIPVIIRKKFFEHFNADKTIAKEIASCLVTNPYTIFQRHAPTNEEIIFEEESFVRSLHGNIILYDGFELQNLIKNIIPEEEIEDFHVIFTTKLTCTYDYEDFKYHGRAVICSNPSIISTTGIIEAPAKPREYYLNMYQNMMQGLNVDSLKEQFKGRFLEYNDNRLDAMVRGYFLQALFYYITAEPFCNSKDCILYNAHWQEDLIHSQINGKLCDKHYKILQSIKIRE